MIHITMSKTLVTSYFMQNNSEVEAARSELFTQGIKTSFNNDVMIFSTLHTAKNSVANPYVQECNGLILEMNTWRPLVVPPRTLRFNINTDATNKFLHQGLYHIYRVEDGTCFNMYYFNNRWVISTARGHTMNDTKWNGTATYQEIITECLERIGLTWESFTAQLNPLRCYSFGFRHPTMQKFMEGGDTPIYKIWFIQSVCTDVNSQEYLWSNDNCPIAIIPTQEVLSTEKVSNMRDLYTKASSALNDFLNKKEVCYGFILRSVNVDQTNEHSDLFVESSLMRTIRKIWYENRLIDACHNNKWNKDTAVVLNAYLNTKDYEVFQRLFPQYQEQLSHYHEVVSQIASEMANRSLNVQATESYNDVVTHMLTAFSNDVKYDPKGQTHESLVKLYMPYICHQDSLDVLMPLF